jgi:hypothetical protein
MSAPEISEVKMNGLRFTLRVKVLQCSGVRQQQAILPETPFELDHMAKLGLPWWFKWWVYF